MPMRIGALPSQPDRAAAAQAEARLVQVASHAMEVAFGDTVVGAGQDWVFTSTPTATGWQLTDAETSAQVNWFPGFSD